MTYLTILLWILISLGGLCLAGAWWLNRQADIKRWNGGICAESGKPWMPFYRTLNAKLDYRAYSDGEGHYCWIRHNVDWRE